MITLATDYVLGTQKNIPSVGDTKWSGLSIYMKAALNSVYSISPRYEIFDDSDNGFAIAGGLSATGIKFSSSYRKLVCCSVSKCRLS